MSVQYYPNGIGGSVGDVLDTCKPLQTTGNVWYVSSLTGTDAASPAGQNREKPLATVAQAVTNSADDDIIVFLPGHAQIITAIVTIAKRLTFIGEGLTSGKPSVSFTPNIAANPIFNVQANNVEFRNIYFPAALSASGTNRITWVAARGRISGCYFEFGAFDTVAGINLLGGSDQMRIDSTTMISVATSSGAQPHSALKTNAAVADLEISNTVISSGVFGFSNYAAVDLSAAAATRCKFQSISLLLGADVNMGSGATGFVNVQLATGGSRVAWG